MHGYAVVEQQRLVSAAQVMKPHLEAESRRLANECGGRWAGISWRDEVKREIRKHQGTFRQPTEPEVNCRTSARQRPCADACHAPPRARRADRHLSDRALVAFSLAAFEAQAVRLGFFNCPFYPECFLLRIEIGPAQS